MTRFRLILGSVAALAMGVLALAASRHASAQTPPKNAALPKQVTSFLRQHCFSCHGPEKKRGELALHTFTDEASIIKGRKQWQVVIERLASGEMPPPERARPKQKDVEAFLQSVHGIFERHDRAAGRDPGLVTMRRLNRTEYNNTIRDLVGVDFQPAEDFPADDVGYGFDNIGDVLSVSPLLMERYLAAAEAIMARAIVVGEPPKAGSRRLIARFLEPPAQMREVRIRELTKDRLSAPWTLQQAGEYTFRVKMAGRAAAGENPRVALLHEDKELRVVEVKPVEDSKQAEVYEAKLRLKAGSTRFAAKLLNPGGEPARAVLVSWFEVAGPADPYPPSHHKLLAAGSGPKEAQTREILERFAGRAYRRQATNEEVERLTEFAKDAQDKGEKWEGAIALAMQAVLCSPKFLFRVELDHRPSEKGPHPVDDYHLASRLSYFLWSTMPDDELLALAAARQLHPNLEPQVRRMLRDPKAAALVENFAVQWLQLRPLKTHTPDRELFPDFSERLRVAMLKETELFFGEIVRGDRSILELIDSDYSFVNERLARHYGIDYPGKSERGSGFRSRFAGNEKFEKVYFKNGERGGLLTQASILTANSNPTRTNPVKRGKWVLEQLLGTPPPPPPPDVPELAEANNKQLQGTLRQRLEQHRQDAACAVCHNKMDPLGLAFENYDAIGRFRTKEGDAAIDPSGVLPGGQKFNGAAELKKILLEKKDLFARCLAEKMVTYAAGRGLEYYDRRAIDQIVAALAKNDYRFSTLVVEVARSDPFRMRRGKDQ